MNKISYVKLERTAPSPADFDTFLPWACNQMSVEVNINITRTYLTEYVSVAGAHSKTKRKPKRKPAVSHSNSDSSVISDYKTSSSFSMGVMHDENVINVETIYDNMPKLVKINFNKNKTIPRVVMKIIGLMVPFHTSLTSITINNGLQMEAMYEISQFLNLSNITEICLDHTYLAEANYYVLLGHNKLKILSLAKCKINDAVVKTIATKLEFSYPASKTLSVLNLATNRVTDLGAKYLAETLRTNRQLSYLNLADNIISDKGAVCILNSLAEFSLTELELKSKKERYMAYLKEKQEFIYKTIKELQTGEFEKRVIRRKSTKPVAVTSMMKKKVDKIISVAGDNSKSTYTSNIDSIYYEKAEVCAINTLGPFTDPFSPINTELRDGVTYCYGNNTLCYLNLAYNNLTYFSIKRLYEVLMMQKLFRRKPKGLVNVMIEGNYLPKTCPELQQIDELLEAGFAHIRNMSGFPKRKSRPSLK